VERNHKYILQKRRQSILKFTTSKTSAISLITKNTGLNMQTSQSLNSTDTQSADMPMCEKQTLFTVGQSDYYCYHIPSLVVTPGGAVLACCEARLNAKYGDWGPIDILMRRSTDGGLTWDMARKIAHLGDPVPLYEFAPNRNDPNCADGQVINNPTLIADHVTGQVHMLYCVEYHRCFYMVSDDDGQTFSKPVQITDCMNVWKKQVDWKIIATGPGHGIQLRNGRLIVPTWLSTGGDNGYEHHPNTLSVLYSDDHGKTWHAGDILAPIENEWNLNETEAVELSDGSVMFNIRNTRTENHRMISTSPNGATNWTEPIFEEQLFEPVCMASIINLGPTENGGPNRIAYSGPAGQRFRTDRQDRTHHCKREDLTIRLSLDDARTWSFARELQHGLTGYSDLAVLPDQTILCLYTAKNSQDVLTMDFARFNLSWLTTKVMA
jgi:sialidase-1